MKPGVVALFALMLLGCAVAAWGQEGANVAPATRPKCLLTKGQMIVFEGDSLTSRRAPPALDTWPYLRLNNWDITYADRMSEWLFCNRPELQLRFHITAVGGSALRDVMKRYEPMIKPMRPDWLVLTISANDQAQQVPLKDFAAQADELCGKLTADSGGRVVWVDTGPPPGETEERRAARDSYRKAMADAVARHKGITVPVEDVLLRKGAALAESWSGHTIGTGADGHLNIIGAEIVSTQVLQALGVLTVNE